MGWVRVFFYRVLGPPTTPAPWGGDRGGGAKARDHPATPQAHGGGLFPRTTRPPVRPHPLTPQLAQAPPRPRRRLLPPCAARCRQVRTTAPPTLCQAMANHHPPPATEKLTTFRRGFFRVPPVQRRRGQDTRMRAGPFARTPKKHQKQRQKTRQEEAAKQGVTDRIVSGPGP